jgi:hypothetical protein
MICLTDPVDKTIHETAIALARRCRSVIQAVLREEEWRDADYEFYLIIRAGLEEFASAVKRESPKD